MQEYSEHIQQLKDEMEEAYSTAERIRHDMQNQKKKYTFVRATDKCCMCKNHLMAKPFHLFINCGHKFHSDCLILGMYFFIETDANKKVTGQKIG